MFDLWGSAPQKIEAASKAIGEFVAAQGLGANDCVTLFTVLAVRCARLAGATKEQYLNYTSQMYDEKSELSKGSEPLIKLS
jgi:hypothetical protein